VGGADVVLDPCMGGHRIVTCIGTADLTTEGVFVCLFVCMSAFFEKNKKLLAAR
jgi:hypothetical protein